VNDLIRTVNVRELDVITLEDAQIAADDHQGLSDATGVPFFQWARRCHEMSLKVLRTGRFGRGRVARGTCEGVGSQHSWIVLGDDVYDDSAPIVDPVLWSYRDDVDGIFAGFPEEHGHVPHGSGAYFTGARPYHHGGPDITLTPAVPLSTAARHFLETLLPLDLHGWGEVAHLPAGGWPSAEIISAMCDTPGLGVLVPVDIVGHLTDRNPSGLYW
jgi:hypothetical protein